MGGVAGSRAAAPSCQGLRACSASAFRACFDPIARLNTPACPSLPSTHAHCAATGRRRFTITRLPRFLMLHVRRFLKNQFFMEKNPTIVNFPVKNLELAACIPVPEGALGQSALCEPLRLPFPA